MAGQTVIEAGVRSGWMPRAGGNPASSSSGGWLIGVGAANSSAVGITGQIITPILMEMTSTDLVSCNEPPDFYYQGDFVAR